MTIQETDRLGELERENKFIRKKCNINAMILRQWQEDHNDEKMKSKKWWQFWIQPNKEVIKTYKEMEIYERLKNKFEL